MLAPETAAFICYSQQAVQRVNIPRATMNCFNFTFCHSAYPDFIFRWPVLISCNPKQARFTSFCGLPGQTDLDSITMDECQMSQQKLNQPLSAAGALLLLLKVFCGHPPPQILLPTPLCVQAGSKLVVFNDLCFITFCHSSGAV